MKNPVNEMNNKIRALLEESYRGCVAEGLLPEAELMAFDIEQPKDAKKGKQGAAPMPGGFAVPGQQPQQPRRKRCRC